MIKSIHRSSTQSKDDLKQSFLHLFGNLIVSTCRICRDNHAFTDNWLFWFTDCSSPAFNVGFSQLIHDPSRATSFGTRYSIVHNDAVVVGTSCSCNELCGAKTQVPGPCQLGSGHNGSPTSSIPNHWDLVWFQSSYRSLFRGTPVANDTWSTQLVEVLLMIERFSTSQFSSQVCCIIKSSMFVCLCLQKNKDIAWAPLSTISDRVMFLVVEFLQLSWYLFIVLENMLFPMWNICEVVSGVSGGYWHSLWSS